MLLQLNPPIPVSCPKGNGFAQVLIDYGPDYDLLWVVFLNDTGECWTFPNHEIRGVRNITLGRGQPDAGQGPRRSGRT